MQRLNRQIVNIRKYEKMFEKQYIVQNSVWNAVQQNSSLQRAVRDGYDIAGRLPKNLSSIRDLRSIPAVQQQINAWPQIQSVFAQTDKFTATLGRELSAAIGPVARSQGDYASFRPATLTGISGALSNLPNLTSLGNFWDSIGRASEGLREMMDRAAREGEAVLEETEYGFADHLWDRVYLASFTDYPKTTRAAVVTTRLAAFTRSDAFTTPLLEEIAASRMLRRRSRVIERALEAHQRREYELSIPPLFAQIEGALGDAMFLKDLVVKDGNKYYLVGPDGKPEENRNGRRLPPITLDPAVRNANLDEDPDLEGASQFLASVLVPRRNDVLHGRDVAYARAKYSVQALLMLAVIVGGFEQLEDR